MRSCLIYKQVFKCGSFVPSSKPASFNGQSRQDICAESSGNGNRKDFNPGTRSSADSHMINSSILDIRWVRLARIADLHSCCSLFSCLKLWLEFDQLFFERHSLLRPRRSSCKNCTNCKVPLHMFATLLQLLADSMKPGMKQHSRLHDLKWWRGLHLLPHKPSHIQTKPAFTMSKHPHFDPELSPWRAPVIRTRKLNIA